MYFLRNFIFHFPSKEKKLYFRKKRKYHFPRYYKWILQILHTQCDFLERPSFWNIWRQKVWFFVQCLIYICIKSNCFIFTQKVKILKNVTFPDNTRKIIFQCNFFWKVHLFRIFGKRKYSFCAVLGLYLHQK